MSGLLVRCYNSAIERSGDSFGRLADRRVRSERTRFPLISSFLSQIPFAIGWKFRAAVYRRLLSAMGSDVFIHQGVVIEDQRSTFGNDIWVSVGSYIDYVHIEDHVLIGQHVVLLSGKNHHNTDRLDIPIKLQGNPEKEPITIGRGAWIGANATVMADVGHDAIVGAGSVVTKPVPPFAIVAGNPARVIRMRNE